MAKIQQLFLIEGEIPETVKAITADEIKDAVVAGCPEEGFDITVREVKAGPLKISTLTRIPNDDKKPGQSAEK